MYMYILIHIYIHIYVRSIIFSLAKCYLCCGQSYRNYMGNYECGNIHNYATNRRNLNYIQMYLTSLLRFGLYLIEITVTHESKL